MKKPFLSLVLLPILATNCSSPRNYFNFNDEDHRVAIRFPRGTPDPEFFAGEQTYLNARREAVGSKPLKIGEKGTTDAVGLAFSGGGLRSAYFNLGVLEGLQSTGKLKTMDYLSTSSGGSYVGSWLVSHWDNPEGKLKTAYGTNGFFFSKPDSILDGESCEAAKLQSQGFVVGVGPQAATRDTLKHIASYSVKFVPNLVFDVAAHYKPAPGKFNAYHLIYNYRQAIERGFLPKTDDTSAASLKRIAMQDINPRGSSAPYLIVNASLANDEPLTLTKPSTWLGRVLNPKKWTELHQFEFTRDCCGGPEIGFVPTHVFDHAVGRTKAWSPDAALGRDVPHELRWRSSVLPGARPTKPFPVSNAVSASGAALDASGTDYRLFLDRILKPFNLNLRYQTANFAQSWSSTPTSLLDRSREILVDRLRPTFRSNSLYLSDAGHFDNLAMSALVHRGVRTIYVIDAGQDGGYNFSDVEKTKGKIESMKCPCCGDPLHWSLSREALGKGVIQRPDNPKLKGMDNFIIRSRISGGCGGYVAEVIYIKASYLPKFVDEDPLLKKYVKTFADKDKHFPHEPTFHITPYSEEMFNAYRALGSFAARCLAQNKHVTTIY